MGYKNNIKNRLPKKNINRRLWLKNTFLYLFMGSLFRPIHGFSAVNHVTKSDTTGNDILKFIEISQCLTERKNLNYQTAVLLYNNIIRSNASRHTQLRTIHNILSKSRIKKPSSISRLCEKHDKNLKDAIHDILLAWYRGVAGNKVITYGNALMFKVTQDSIFPKTLAQGSVFYWSKRPTEVAKPTITRALSASPLVLEPV